MVVTIFRVPKGDDTEMFKNSFQKIVRVSKLKKQKDHEYMFLEAKKCYQKAIQFLLQERSVSFAS